MNLSKKVLCLSLCILFSSHVFARADGNMVIPRTTMPPLLKDYLHGVPANAGMEVKNLVQNNPGDGTPETRATKAYISHDDDYLYAVFIADANHKKLNARYARRENYPGEDFVLLQIDSFNDKQSAFVFYANPYGVQADSRFIEGKEEDFDFDTQWQTEGELTPAGYIVKMRIPFKSLRFNPGAVQNWGVSVARFIPENGEFNTWPHISKQKASVVAQFAPVKIDSAITPGRNFQLNPYLYTGVNKTLGKMKQHGRTHYAFSQQRATQTGLDAKYVWNNSFAFDATVKPDFSEVESDEPQVLVDKRFETFFPEKRPFFLENAGFFQTPQKLFFSRRIREPDVGLRVSGRAGKLALGGLVINDVALGESDKAHIALLRAQYDLSDTSYIGMIANQRRVHTDISTVSGVDFRSKPTQNWIITGQYAVSQSEQEKNKSGKLAYLETGYRDREINYTGKYLNISQNFDAQLGYLPRINIQQSEQVGKKTWYTETSDWLNFHSLQATVIATRNQHHDWLDKKNDLLYTLNDKYANTIKLQTTMGVENLAQRDIHTRAWQATWTSKTLPWLATTLGVGQKQALNYRYTDRNVLSGDASNYLAKFSWKPNAHWKLDGSYYWNDLRHQGQHIYRDRLARADISYQHNNYLGATLVFDYDDLSANKQWSRLESGKNLNTNLQLRYVLNPGTSIYLSYTDRQENLSLRRDIDGLEQLHLSENLDLHTGRRLFLKMNYLYQL